MAENEIIVNKNGMVLTRESKNNYLLNFSITNPTIDLKSLVNLNLIKLFCDINTDIFEEYELNLINDTEAELYILFKHILKDFGLPQSYCYLKIDLVQNKTEPNKVFFISKTIYDKPLPKPYLKNTDFIKIDDMHTNCIIQTDHVVDFVVTIKYNLSLVIFSFVEKIAGQIISKIFFRSKKFIEGINIKT